MYWKCNVYIKYFDKIKCYANQPYLVFPELKPETHTYFFFFCLIWSELKPEAHTYCFCHYKNKTSRQLILIMCMQYLFQRVNRTPHPKQTNKQKKKKKNSLPCLCDIPIFGVDRNVLWILRVNRHPSPQKNKVTTHIPKYSYKLKNPMYYGSITLEFRKDSKPLWLPTKDLVFFRFRIFPI